MTVKLKKKLPLNLAIKAGDTTLYNSGTYSGLVAIIASRHFADALLTYIQGNP